MCDSMASKRFFEKSSVEDKSILELPDACHEVIKDREFASLVISETITWQNMHLV